MKFVVFCHSLRSDWNHGNAHFLRGVCREIQDRGHRVEVFEPANAWSVQNLIEDRGSAAVEEYREFYPSLNSIVYDPATLDLDTVLAGADVVLVHEWNDHDLVARIGEHRSKSDYRLFFHDTHHRSVTDEKSMAGYDLRHYDAVLAFGDVIRDRYLEKGWAKAAWTWHEAADPSVFHPQPSTEKVGDLVWVGNWGDDERTEELHEFLLGPVKRMGLNATIYGVRYPEAALKALADAGIRYGGSLANYRAPEVFAQHRVTVHVPRRPYVEALPGIPTIRVFEALACGIPLVSAPWNDAEGLFDAGRDYLVASDGAEMERQLRWVLDNPVEAKRMAAHGQAAVLRRHTCGHRVDELLQIVQMLETEQKGEVMTV